MTTESHSLFDADRHDALDRWGSRSGTVIATLLGVPALVAALISMLAR